MLYRHAPETYAPMMAQAADDVGVDVVFSRQIAAFGRWLLSAVAELGLVGGCTLLLLLGLAFVQLGGALVGAEQPALVQA